jgi:acetyl-CoA carboxylase biotin carboxyl carrier protein
MARSEARPIAQPAKESKPVSVEVEAEITGNVWKIEKAVGETVEEEDVLLIIESMKMEIPVEAPCAGRVVEVRVSEGQSIEEGDILVVLGS